MADAYLVSLCREYIDLVNNMRSGGFNIEEIRRLDSDRLVLHTQLWNLPGWTALPICTIMPNVFSMFQEQEG